MAEDLYSAGICSTTTMSSNWWNYNTMRSTTPSSSFELPPQAISCSAANIRDIITNDPVTWSTQHNFLPAELNQIQPGFGDSSLNQFDEMNNYQALLPGFFEPINDGGSVQQASSWANFNPNQISRVSSPSPSKQQQLNFSNNTTSWNPSENISVPAQSAEVKKQGGDQPASKKQRVATPSPLPTFKVRKEKLGDRITALQQLVSPFGKTDTASVLHEAIDYIRFLHGQVGALSNPYLKNGYQMQHRDEGMQDLRSRGLCLVPVSSTFAVASETPMDFWSPTFLGGKGF